MEHTVSRTTQKYIDACHSCSLVCKQAIIYCIHEGGRHTDPEHLEQIISCAVICQASTDVMVAHSQYRDQMCLICADICESGAESCDQFDDRDMKKCAKECRACANACKDMMK